MFKKLFSGMKASVTASFSGIGKAFRIITSFDDIIRFFSLLRDCRNAMKYPAVLFFVEAKKQIEQFKANAAKTPIKTDDAIVSIVSKPVLVLIKFFHLEQEVEAEYIKYSGLDKEVGDISKG